MKIPFYWPPILLWAALGLLALYLHWTGVPVYWGGFAAIMLFYGLIFLIGFWAASRRGFGSSDEVLLAGRSIPLWVGMFTMSATWIDGGYINGTAEYVGSAGLMWVQAPWCYALSLVIGGLFFARPMYRSRYTTMLDPLAQRFGERMGAVLYLPALAGEVFWTSAILVALGATFETVLQLDSTTAIVLSAVIALIYTSFGGLLAMAYTDVLQIALILLGMFLVAPYALQQVGGLSAAWTAFTSQPGHKGFDTAVFSDWVWWDSALLLIFGGIPWQVYFQRVLSARDERAAVGLSLGAGAICLIVAIPCVLIGVAGDVFPWGSDGYPPRPEARLVLPYVVRYLTPFLVGILGLGAVAAAVMSSVDASLLSSSTMASWNVWRPFFRPRATPEELAKTLRLTIWFVGGAALLLALKVKSVYGLWFLCSDFVYCLLFPQLVCALFDPRANRNGSMAAFAVSFVLRIGAGDATLGLPQWLPYPEGFPVKTVAMLAGLLVLPVVSRIFPREQTV